MKKPLNERFQKLAGIKPLQELELGDKEFVISSPAEEAIETRDINTTIIKLYDKEAREDVGYIKLNVLDLMLRGVIKSNNEAVYEAWAEFAKSIDNSQVSGI